MMISEWLREHEVTFTTTHIDERPDGMMEFEGHKSRYGEPDHWLCRFHLPGQENTLDVYFTQGPGYVGKPPKAERVFGCILDDARGADVGWEEWADDLGYNRDSIKDNKIYQACQKERKDLAAFIPTDAMLDEVYRLEEED